MRFYSSNLIAFHLTSKHQVQLLPDSSFHGFHQAFCEELPLARGTLLVFSYCTVDNPSVMNFDDLSQDSTQVIESAHNSLLRNTY